MDEILSLLRQELPGRYPVTECHLEQLARHFELLRKWNRKVNLTSIRAPADVVRRHYCESVALAFALPAGALRVIDAGSGAGFPGFPLAVVRPECRVYLVESDGRKAVFLRESVLEVANAQVMRSRLEDVRVEVDWLVSRGVRWEHLRRHSRRLARHVALMASLDTAAAIRSDPHFAWNQEISLPWGARRILLLGEISRETGPA